MFLLYGILFERVQGFIRTALVYEVGVFGGALAHISVWPYRSLIGCSHGVYALYGACLAHIILNIFQTQSQIGGCMVVSVVLQVVTDLISFLLWFNADVGYAAHVGGFFTGLFLALTIASKLKKECWKVILACLSFLILTGYLIGVSYRVENTWPPMALVESSWSPIDQLPCCAEMLILTCESPADNVDDSYYCDGLDLVPY
jgi:membrane associated rhomboid family serine protease